MGRKADVLAMIFAGLGAALSFVLAVWFFLGFAENDTRPEHLVSAIFLTCLLFIFAIGPFTIVTEFARRAYRDGTKRSSLLWTLFLMLPWFGLGLLSVSHTPLPIWCGLTLAGLAGVLSLWALISLLLDWNDQTANTVVSQQNEMSDASE